MVATNWFNLCFCRFEGIGIYVVMFWEILRTLMRVVMLFFYLMLAFSLAFYALMLNQVGMGYVGGGGMWCFFNLD